MRARTCVSVVVFIARKLRPCPSYSRRRDRNNSVHWRSLYKGGGVQPCIPTQQFVHQMLIFCGFRSLPSQSQVLDSLLRLCSEALFHAKRRVVLPLRGGFQALLSRCTILPIISCSSVALSKCLHMVGQHRPTRVHTGRDADSVFVWVMSKKPWHSSPCPQRRRLVHQLHSGRFLRHQVGCIIHHPHVM